MKIGRKNYKGTNSKYSHSAKAVVLGLGINGLGIVRSLGKKGVEVWGVYESENEPGRFSKYVQAAKFPSLKNNESLFLQKLIDDFGDTDNKAILFAPSDLYVVFMSQKRDLLQKYFRFNLPENEVLESLISKERASDYARKRGLQVPKTYTIKKNEDIENVLINIELPCVVKPVDSFSSGLKKKALIFTEHRSLNEFLKNNKDIIDQIIIQQIIPGGDENIYQATSYVTREGVISPIFTMRKIRQYRPDFGITSYGISENVPEIKEKLQNFIESMNNYKGFISVEFKKHPLNGEWYYIETNPRLPYYNSLIYDAGINYPYIYYLDMLEKNNLEWPRADQKEGVRWINFTSDLLSFVQKYIKGQISLPGWLIEVLQSGSYAYFDKKDLMPFFYLIARDFKTLIIRGSIKLIKYLTKSSKVNYQLQIL